MKNKYTGFVLFYAKDDVLYPVALDKEQRERFELLIPTGLGGRITVIDEPQGEVESLKQKPIKKYESEDK